MRDEYILKLKLRDGAINLAQALSSQPSKAAKEKLQEVRSEQKDLLEVISKFMMHMYKWPVYMYVTRKP